MLTREQILNASDIKTVSVSVPEWGGEVYVRSITGKQRDAVDRLIAASGEGSGYPGFRGMLCAFSVCDENGNPVFSAADADALEQKNAAVLQRIFEAALDVNGMSSEEAKKRKASFPE